MVLRFRNVGDLSGIITILQRGASASGCSLAQGVRVRRWWHHGNVAKCCTRCARIGSALSDKLNRQVEDEAPILQTKRRKSLRSEARLVIPSTRGC